MLGMSELESLVNPKVIFGLALQAGRRYCWASLRAGWQTRPQPEPVSSLEPTETTLWIPQNVLRLRRTVDE